MFRYSSKISKIWVSPIASYPLLTRNKCFSSRSESRDGTKINSLWILNFMLSFFKIKYVFSELEIWERSESESDSNSKQTIYRNSANRACRISYGHLFKERDAPMWIWVFWSLHLYSFSSQSKRCTCSIGNYYYHIFITK